MVKATYFCFSLWSSHLFPSNPIDSNVKPGKIFFHFGYCVEESGLVTELWTNGCRQSELGGPKLCTDGRWMWQIKFEWLRFICEYVSFVFIVLPFSFTMQMYSDMPWLWIILNSWRHTQTHGTYQMQDITHSDSCSIKIQFLNAFYFSEDPNQICQPAISHWKLPPSGTPA